MIMTIWATIPSVGDRAAVASSLSKDLLAIASWAEGWLQVGRVEQLLRSKNQQQGQNSTGLISEASAKADSDEVSLDDGTAKAL